MRQHKYTIGTSHHHPERNGTLASREEGAVAQVHLLPSALSYKGRHKARRQQPRRTAPSIETLHAIVVLKYSHENAHTWGYVTRKLAILKTDFTNHNFG